MRTHWKTQLVGRTLVLLFGIQWLTFQIMLRGWDRTEVAARFFLGNDFSYFYNAAGLFLSGRSPYLETNFIPLPPALYLPMLLHRFFSFWTALIVFRTVTFVLVIAAMLWLCRELRLSGLNSALILAIAVMYAPFYSILAGGNLDGLMLVFLVFACARNAGVRGACLGLSIATKFYSVLLVPVLALRRRRLELLWAAGVFAVLLLPFLRYLPAAVSSVFHRTSILRLNSNESPAVLFILMFGPQRVWAWRSCYILLWGGTLLARLAADWKKSGDFDGERFLTLDYLPWMAGAPVLVFTYTGTILLPVVACLARKNQDRGLNWAEWITVAGFILTGFYPMVVGGAISSLGAILHLSLSSGTLNNMLMAAAPLGISAMLLGSSAATSGPGKKKVAEPVPCFVQVA